MNNKGFAITGILYTLLILFLTVMVSVLAGLRSKKNMLEQSIIPLEDSFKGTKLSTNQVQQAKNSKVAPVDGKYEFLVTFLDSDTRTCYAYLTKNTKIDDNIIFTRKECNEYSSTTSNLQQIYSFEEE